MSQKPTAPAAVVRVPGESAGDDLVAVEEPLEIRAGERPIVVTMRTPGDDADLARGFLVTEGILRSWADIVSLRHWGSPNVIRVKLRDGVRIDFERLQRHFYTSSSCGICGKASIDAIRVHARKNESAARIDPSVLKEIPAAMRQTQTHFATTGGLHAAAIFSTDGRILISREDVGRHNAVDKAIGAIADRKTLRASGLVVSGRAGFEIVQKAAVAGIPIVAAVGAPTSLAIETARELGVTLAAFVRDERFNLYAEEWRVG